MGSRRQAGGAAAAGRERLSVNTTTVGNVGGGEDDLMSYSVLAGQLAADKDTLHFLAWGKCHSNAATRTVGAYVDGTQHDLLSIASGINEAAWIVTTTITRLSATSLDVLTKTEFNFPADAGPVTNIKRATEAVADVDANAFTVKCTGEDAGSSTDEVEQFGLIVDYVPAPA